LAILKPPELRFIQNQPFGLDPITKLQLKVNCYITKHRCTSLISIPQLPGDAVNRGLKKKLLLDYQSDVDLSVAMGLLYLVSIHKQHLLAPGCVFRFFEILKIARYSPQGHFLRGACGFKNAIAFRLRLKATPRHVPGTKIYYLWMGTI
jgi:hypothetical protein